MHKVLVYNLIMLKLEQKTSAKKVCDGEVVMLLHPGQPAVLVPVHLALVHHPALRQVLHMQCSTVHLAYQLVIVRADLEKVEGEPGVCLALVEAQHQQEVVGRQDGERCGEGGLRQHHTAAGLAGQQCVNALVLILALVLVLAQATQQDGLAAQRHPGLPLGLGHRIGAERPDHLQHRRPDSARQVRGEVHCPVLLWPPLVGCVKW